MSKVVRYQIQKVAGTGKLDYLNFGEIENVESLLTNTVYSLKSVIKGKEPSLGNVNDSSIQLWQMQQEILIKFDEYSTVSDVVESTREVTCPVFVRFREILQRLEFQPVKPPGLNGECLFEREDAATFLAQCLLSGSGTPLTPISDLMHGAGKTDFFYKFRNYINAEIASKLDGYNDLIRAVYVHVNFAHPTLNHLQCNGSVMEQYVCKVTKSALCTSAGDRLPMVGCSDCITFISDLAGVVGKTKLLIHFDEVGAFDGYGEVFAGSVIYTIWNLGQKFRNAGHFFTMSGRSSLLHRIGQNKLKIPGFSSPNPTLLIHLPPLSPAGVRAMVEVAKAKGDLPAWFCDGGDKLVEVLAMLTGGVPRAVFLALQKMKLSGSVSCLDDTVSDMQKDCLKTMAMSMVDTRLFYRALELAWAGVEFSEKSVFGGENVVALSARLGLYRASTKAEHFKLVAPVFLIRFFAESGGGSVRSMAAIAEYDCKSTHLECSFRRIFRLRCALEAQERWGDVGLPFLDHARVPFQTVMEGGIFPKIMKEGRSRSDADMAAFFFSARPTVTEFPAVDLPRLYRALRKGVYYQPTPQSGSADAILTFVARVDEGAYFQFKNLPAPISENAIKEEALKCKAKGWTVHLIVVSTAGHNVQGGIDCEFEYEGVHIVALSKASVQAFLGEDAFNAIVSSSMVQDVVQCIGISPMKATISDVEIKVEKGVPASPRSDTEGSGDSSSKTSGRKSVITKKDKKVKVVVKPTEVVEEKATRKRKAAPFSDAAQADAVVKKERKTKARGGSRLGKRNGSSFT